MNFRFLTWPNPIVRKQDNPYLHLFYQALEGSGIRNVGELDLDGTALDRLPVEGIHIHWPEHLWRRRGVTTFPKRYANLAKLRKTLRDAKHRGLCRVWTVHNLHCHEGNDWVDWLGFQIMYQNSDVLICHDEETARNVRRLCAPLAEIVVMPMGNYEGIYPPARERSTVLAELGLDPELPTVTCLGSIRRYKGIDIACRALQNYPGPIQLIVAGSPLMDEGELTSLRRMVQQLEGGVMIERALSDPEFSDLAGASDVILLPYRSITGSGALFAAWTLGRGVVASDLPFFRSSIGNDPCAGALFRAGNPDDLRRVLFDYLKVPSAKRRAAALKKSGERGWSHCVVPVAKTLRQWARGESE